MIIHMRYLSDEEKEQAQKYIDLAIKEAQKSDCLKSKCGSIIIKENKIIGKGHNSPPAELESQRRCSIDKKSYHEKITDKTCCIHAEQRAIINALKENPSKIKDSMLYFIRLDKNNNKIYAEKPYCTICSKIALDVGIKYFVLFHKEGICEYDTEEYNNLSFNYEE